MGKQAVIEVLRNHGASVTAPRLALFEILEGSEPLSFEEIYQALSKKSDRSSIYRAINLFVELGIAHKVNIGWKYKIELTDAFSEHHHHLTCTKCHKIVSISEKELENFILKITNSEGFQPLSHQIEIQGLCKNCSKKSPTSTRKNLKIK